jgi:lipid-binding SYLF domain-containing protein
MMSFRTLLVLFAFLFVWVPAQAASKDELDAEVREAVENFYQHTSAGKELAARASGMLVFPNVLKAGVGIGGEYGEGALLVGGKPTAYYNIAAASIGFQLGAQARSQIILFMTPGALSKFRSSKGWKAGVDGSVALATWALQEPSTVKPPRSPSSGSSFPTRD